MDRGTLLKIGIEGQEGRCHSAASTRLCSPKLASTKRQAGLARTQLMFDAYHIGREGRDPVTEYDRLARYVGHVQIASVPSRTEPDTGDVDYANFLRHLRLQAYGGWIGCEYLPRTNVEAGLPGLRAIATCFAGA